MQIPSNWTDYALLDAGGGEKLERWGGVIVARPDPQAIWPKDASAPWDACHLRYHRSKTGGGGWERRSPAPDRWTIGYKDLRFIIRPTDFKHMGLFPEQAVNWDWMRGRLSAFHEKTGSPARALNLFGYTGGATAALAKAGARVTHVDAAKSMNLWARENALASGADGSGLRFIADDALKFVTREARRGNRCDAVVMDPPSYGRGAGGEVWKIEERLFELAAACAGLLSENPAFFVINSYTTGFSPTVLENVLRLALKLSPKRQNSLEAGEVGLRAANGLVLPCGAYCRAVF